MVTAADDRLGNNSPHHPATDCDNWLAPTGKQNPLKMGKKVIFINKTRFTSTKQVQLQCSKKTVLKLHSYNVFIILKSMRFIIWKWHQEEDGIKVLTGPCLGICGEFYHKNILLPFLNLESDSKLCTERAEDSESTYVGCGYKRLLDAFPSYTGTAFGANVFVEKCLNLVQLCVFWEQQREPELYSYFIIRASEGIILSLITAVPVYCLSKTTPRRALEVCALAGSALELLRDPCRKDS